MSSMLFKSLRTRQSRRRISRLVSNQINTLIEDKMLSFSPQQDIPPLPRLTPSPELSLPDEAPIVPLLRVPTPPAAAPKKKKKAKGRNGNIYIGVANRIWWLKLQQQFGFDNINSFGNFVMGYMNKVHW